jgi:hypothetical protein
MNNESEKPRQNGDSRPIPQSKRKTIKKQQQVKRELISSDDLPKKTLEDALRVPGVIKDNYGKTAAGWEQIAEAMGISANTGNNKYLLWSATAYGIITKDDQGNYNISENGRKILAPTFDGEDREGIIKAIPASKTLNHPNSPSSDNELYMYWVRYLFRPIEKPARCRPICRPTIQQPRLAMAHEWESTPR